MLAFIAAKTACSFGISRMPASPSGRAMCAIDVQINMASPPKTPAARIRIISKRMKIEGWIGKEEGENSPGAGYGVAGTSFALRLICVPDNATETGQVFFVNSACSLNFASLISGTSALVVTLIEVILKPPPEGSSFTSAVVLIFLGG